MMQTRDMICHYRRYSTQKDMNKVIIFFAVIVDVVAVIIIIFIVFFE